MVGCASHLITLDKVDQAGEAETLLLALPHDGRVLQQLVKLLCSQGRVEFARLIWPTSLV